MRLCTIRVGERLNKCILILSMFRIVMTEARENCRIEYLGLTACFLMIRCCLQVSNTENGAHGGENFAKEFSSIVN